jgi:hypothetical protein
MMDHMERNILYVHLPSLPGLEVDDHELFWPVLQGQPSHDDDNALFTNCQDKHMIYAISSVQLAKTGQMHLDQSYSGLQQQELSVRMAGGQASMGN